MGPVSAVSMGGQSSAASALSGAGPTASAATAQSNGARLAPAAAAESARPVAAATGSERSSSQHSDQSYLVEIAKERAQSAHRAYLMAMLALGENPLRDPVP